MPRTLTVAVIIGIALLIIPVVYLAATNYSARVIQPALVIVGSALITLLVTLAVTLRETKWEEILYATVITDSKNLPAEVASIGPNMPIGLRLSDYRDLALKAIGPKADAGLEESEASVLFQQLIQVVVLEHAAGRYSDGWARTFLFPKALGSFQLGSVSQEIPTRAGAERIEARSLWRQLEAKNPVAAAIKNDSGRFRDSWTLPSGTDLTINTISTRPLFDPQPLFELKKPHFFEIKVTVAKGIAHRPVTIPTDVIKLSSTDTAQLTAQTYLVAVSARFFAERSGHPHMESYQQWARGLVQVVRYAVADEPT